MVGRVLERLAVVVARPVAVWLCLLPFGFTRAEIAFVSWVGLRGAVSILLAILSASAGWCGMMVATDGNTRTTAACAGTAVTAIVAAGGCAWPLPPLPAPPRSLQHRPLPSMQALTQA